MLLPLYLCKNLILCEYVDILSLCRHDCMHEKLLVVASVVSDGGADGRAN